MPQKYYTSGLGTSLEGILSDDGLECRILNSFDCNAIDEEPETEEVLIRYYVNNTELVYQYLRRNIGFVLDSMSNEIRAMLGHLADYRIEDKGKDKTNLNKAYGHFRRLTLDALKVLCDEFDKAAVKELNASYPYDLRDVDEKFLLKFSEMYINAKRLYMEAQQKEHAGVDSGKHNIFALYYDAGKAYIELKRYFQLHKSEVVRVRRKAKWRAVYYSVPLLLGIVVDVLELIVK